MSGDTGITQSAEAHLHERPYYAAAGTSLVLAFVWLGLWAANGALPRSESPAFFSTASQVLPILLLTFAVEKRFFHSEPVAQFSATAAVAFSLVMLGSGVGLVMAIVTQAVTGQPSLVLATATTYLVANALASSLALIVASAAESVGIGRVFTARTEIIVSGPLKTLGLMAASLVGAALIVLYTDGMFSDLFGAAPIHIALPTGVISVLWLAAALWVGGRDRRPALRVWLSVGTATAWLGVSLFFGWAVSSSGNGISLAEATGIFGAVFAPPPMLILVAAMRPALAAGIRARLKDRKRTGEPPRDRE
jgi:hypothetical protein